MTHALQSRVDTRASTGPRHWLTAALAVVGVVAGALGAWLSFGPETGTLQIFGWTWNLADISDLWASWLMIGGGLMAVIGMGWETMSGDKTKTWVRALEGLVLGVALVVMGTGVILLF